ncbi:Zn-dependent exopeptidase [Russula earlei]|uniref:Zn-dependent exopeptidase n=1 Tax=Russula earlei TaxID=71964 RepID=A0ACC0UNS9_9AGAM|nr:Zn-dependent exopeptidase [Russula earlei]
MAEEKVDGDPTFLLDLEPANARTSRTKNVAKHFIFFGILCYLLHRWLYTSANHYGLWGSPSAHTCTHDHHDWAIDAFAIEDPEVPTSRLAENFFLTIPNSASAIVASRRYATTPHLAGSKEDLRTAKHFLHLLQHEFSIPNSTERPIYSAGSEASRNATLSITNLTEPAAWIDVYYPVLNTPLDRALEILADDGTTVWKAKLEEVADELDRDAYEHAESIGTWHGLSFDGVAEGRLIYANYGRKGDYDELVQKGIDITGAIVLVRYGGVFRGLKIKGAQELGAAGVLIYSDPRDDGTVTEKNGYAAYPYGPARNPTSVQRGSVQFISLYPGDPTTPGYPSYENSTRTNGSSIPRIPSLPISWANAKVLLEEIEGKNRTLKPRLHLSGTLLVSSLGISRMKSYLFGNHRDAWVLGAADPSSGTVAVHELVRGLGALLKEDWKPLRTIVIASWDGEEYGLIGSTEWGEDFAEWIQKHVVAYINLDNAVAGSTFGAAASPLLSHFIRKTAKDVPHPTDPKRTLWDATADRGQLFGEHDDLDSLGTEIEPQAADSVGIGALGSGSDYTVFLQRLGVTSMDSGGFHSTRSDPVYHYHSIFDSERFQEVYADPGFVKHVAVAKNLGLQTLRLASALVLPFNTTHYAFELENYLHSVEGLAATSSAKPNFAPLRAAIRLLQFASLKLDAEKFTAERVLERQLRKWRKRQRKNTRRGGCLKRFIRRLKSFFTSGPRCLCVNNANVRKREDPAEEADGGNLGKDHKAKANGGKWPLPHIPKHPHWPHRKPHPLPPKLIKAAKAVRKINQKLISFERGFIHEDGIKDREWYRHLGVAPGKWLGYGATPLPALTEAITIEKNVTLANHEVIRLTEAVEKITAVLRG